MSVLDIDKRIERADKQADLYLRWKAEDVEFQKKYPDSLIYSWFAEHSKTWKPLPVFDIHMNPDNHPSRPSRTELEEAYGKTHAKFGPGHPTFLITFYCPAKYMVDINKPGIPPDKSKMPSIYTLTAFSKVEQLQCTDMTITSQYGTRVGFDIDFPPIIALKDVTEWPDWLIDSRKCRCRQPWDNVTFWVDDSCDTKPIDKLIYQPSISCGDPAEYNFFRQSDYFLEF